MNFSLFKWLICMKKYILIIFISLSFDVLSSSGSQPITKLFEFNDVESNDFNCDARIQDGFVKLSFIDEKTKHNDVFKWNKKNVFPSLEYSWMILFEFEGKYFDINIRTSYSYKVNSDFNEFEKGGYENYIFDELKMGGFDDLLGDVQSYYFIYNEDGSFDDKRLDSDSLSSSLENGDLVLSLKNEKLNYLIASDASINALFFVIEAGKKLRKCFTVINKEFSNINTDEININEIWKDVSGYYEEKLEIEREKKNNDLWEEMEELSRSENDS